MWICYGLLFFFQLVFGNSICSNNSDLVKPSFLSKAEILNFEVVIPPGYTFNNIWAEGPQNLIFSLQDNHEDLFELSTARQNCSFTQIILKNKFLVDQSIEVPIYGFEGDTIIETTLTIQILNQAFTRPFYKFLISQQQIINEANAMITLSNPNNLELINFRIISDNPAFYILTIAQNHVFPQLNTTIPNFQLNYLEIAEVEAYDTTTKQILAKTTLYFINNEPLIDNCPTKSISWWFFMYLAMAGTLLLFLHIIDFCYVRKNHEKFLQVSLISKSLLDI